MSPLICCVEVDYYYNCGKFPIEALFPSLHGLVEELLSDWWVGSCDVAHYLKLLSNGFLSGRVGTTNGSLVQL